MRKLFGKTEALKGIDLEIDSGELFFLLGPSGCGKTTLLRTIAGFYAPDGGSITFDGDDVSTVPPHKRRTGMMFQSYALWPHMTVAENVGFGLDQLKVNKEEKQERVAAALASVRMEQYGERKPNQLSGGQQQRVALARALVVRPKCLLLDEPLSNLDAKLRNEMRLEIRRVCKEFKLTTIYVTHDQKEALSIADRMAVFEQGEILQVGAPREVYKRPRSSFVAAFIGEANFLPGSVVTSGAGEVLVKTEIGLLKGVLSGFADEPPEGEAVTVCVRPEAISLGQHLVEENGFKAKVEDSVYFGEVAHYSLRGSENSVLRVSELNPRHATAAIGDEVDAWAEPEDVVVLPKAEKGLS
ncbi:MAG: ABC transporter ATP-binding protein [Puniceicoccaceae bacterium]